MPIVDLIKQTQIYSVILLYNLSTMRKEEIEIFSDISRIQKNQRILLEKPKTPQQLLLQLSGQRFLLSKKMLHKNIEEVLNYLVGSFSQKVLHIGYMSLCLQNSIELQSEDYPILKLLIDWTQFFPVFQDQPQLDLVNIIFQKEDSLSLSSMQQYITYINFIGGDLIKAVRRSKNINLDESLPSSRDSAQKFTFDHLNLDKLLQFINLSLPNILYNIILPNELLPTQLTKKTKNLECLYKNASLQYFMRSSSHYGMVMKILLKSILTIDLKLTQQKLLMDIVFRYFYAFHHDKKYNATDIFIQTYNKLSEPTRFALTDELVLFFRIIGKIGKGKFVQFLVAKSEWLKEITGQINSSNQIGYHKDGVYPHNKIGLSQKIVIGSGKLQTRTFQILEDYSMFYFKIEAVSLDITIKLSYLGDIISQKPSSIVLFQQQKKSGIFQNNVIAAKRGLYMFSFDNSYSWLNSKTVNYSMSLLTPLDIQTKNRYQWINTFYDNVPHNINTNPDKIWTIEKQPVKKEDEFIGTANITKQGTYYNLKIIKPGHIYEYESEDEKKFILKFNQLIDSEGKLNWMIGGEPIEDTGHVQGFVKSSKKEINKKQAAPPKEKIEMNYVEEDEQIEEKPAAVSSKKKDSVEGKKNPEGSKVGSKPDLNESAQTFQKFERM